MEDQRTLEELKKQLAESRAASGQHAYEDLNIPPGKPLVEGEDTGVESMDIEREAEAPYKEGAMWNPPMEASGREFSPEEVDIEDAIRQAIQGGSGEVSPMAYDEGLSEDWSKWGVPERDELEEFNAANREALGRREGLERSEDWSRDLTGSSAQENVLNALSQRGQQYADKPAGKPAELDPSYGALKRISSEKEDDMLQKHKGLK